MSNFCEVPWEKANLNLCYRSKPHISVLEKTSIVNSVALTWSLFAFIANIRYEKKVLNARCRLESSDYVTWQKLCQKPFHCLWRCTVRSSPPCCFPGAWANDRDFKFYLVLDFSNVVCSVVNYRGDVSTSICSLFWSPSWGVSICQPHLSFHRNGPATRVLRHMTSWCKGGVSDSRVLWHHWTWTHMCHSFRLSHDMSITTLKSHVIV